MSMQVKKHLDLLGLRVEDRVTGMTGVVATVAFDLYGCIQAIVNRGLDKDGKPHEQVWIDVARLRVLDANSVMEQPNYEFGSTSEGGHGPAERPLGNKA